MRCKLDSVVLLVFLLLLQLRKCFSTDESLLQEHHSSVESDFHKLLDVEDFQLTITQTSCVAEGFIPDLLVLVHSAPLHFGHRQTIRETWGNKKLSSSFGTMRLLFMLAETHDHETQLKIIHENTMHHDIIQGSFMDAYNNLTYKHVMSLKWFTYFCPEARVLLKTDDDVLVNTPHILKQFSDEFWDDLEKKNNNQEFILCNIMDGSPIIRDPKSKWFVPQEELTGNAFIPYCSGFVIFYSKNAVPKVYQEAQKIPYVRIDDAFVSGMARDKANVQMTDFKDLFFKKGPDQLLDVLKKDLSDKVRRFFVGPVNLHKNTVKELWNALTIVS